MVKLFLSLCAEAGMAVRAAPKRKARRAAGASSRQVRSPAPQSPTQTDRTEPRASARVSVVGSTAAADLSVISALIQRIPPSLEWTTGERQRWMNAMTAGIDLIVGINDKSAEVSSEGGVPGSRDEEDKQDN